MEIQSNDYHDILRNSFSHWYNAGRDSWTAEKAQRGAAELLLEQLPEGRTHHVLDIGTGRGRDLELFLEAGHKATGVDLVALDNWPALRERWGGRISLVHTPFQAFTSEDRFTAALDVGCLHHQHPDEYPAYLEKLHGMLIPGAPCLFSVFTPDDEVSGGELHLLEDQRINRVLSAEEMRDILEAAGFRWIGAKRLLRDRIESFYLLILVERI